MRSKVSFPLIYVPLTPAFDIKETGRELEPKCVPQLFLVFLLETRRSAIGLFVPCPY